MSEWISVEDGLPDEGVWVVIATGDGEVGTGSLAEEDMNWEAHGKTWRVWWQNYSTGTIFGVTHWMPLPKPPEKTQ